MSAPIAKSATASQIAWREKAADTCRCTESFWAIESDTAEAASRSSADTTAAIAARAGRDSRVSAPSATPTAMPAGSHATTIRRSGWASPPASCWSGSAPFTLGPTPRS